jgi:hypothetical protein
MSTGFQSNFNDSGYTLSGTWYDQNGNIVSGSITSRDIYISTQQTGVYMIDGSVGVSNTFYPVNCSAANLINLGMLNDVDDAWLVYPGYGFTLYYDGPYTGTTSRNYINTSTTPVVFYCGSPGGWVGYGTPILTTTGSSYAGNNTNGVRIYFRGTEIRVPTIA